MTKEKTIEGIARAKQVHLMQMKKVKTLISGAEINNPTPVEKTECDFGKWLYDENNHIKELLGDLFYTNMEILHTRWHTEYKRVYEIFCNQKKSGFFSNMFGSTKVTDMEIDKGKLYCSELEITTNELLKIMDVSQVRLHALPENKFH